MENNKTMNWVWAVVAIIVIVGLIFISRKSGNDVKTPAEETGATTTDSVADSPVTATNPETKTPATRTAPKTTTAAKKLLGNVVEYTDMGFEPSVLIIKRGESVEFVNMSDKTMVIRSHDENPANFYPGFSQEGAPLGKGGRFYFAFTIPGTWLYYNLNGNKEQGAIIVQ
jgi:plastocyanin